MTLTLEKSLIQVIKEGKEKSSLLNQEILVSYTKQINPVDPIHFFHNAKMISKGRRTFWSNPKRNFTLVGVDKSFELEDKSSHQFDFFETQWSQLLNNSIIISEKNELELGPILLGGFSFDPLNTKTNLWSKFPHSRLTLPKFMLVQTTTETWFTVNLVISKNDEEELLAKYCLQSEESLLKKVSSSKHKFIFSNNDYEYSEIDPKKWMETVEETASKIRLDQIDKVVLARGLKIKLNGKNQFSVSTILNRLRLQQQSTYLFAIDYEGQCFMGASPERLIKSKGKRFITAALAGATIRGKNKAEDLNLGKKLIEDRKNRHEHQVVVDTIKELMEEVCSDVHIPEVPLLYKTRDIQHLYSPIEGDKNLDISLLTMVKKLHPTPAMNGLPIKTALKLIREKENLDRGWYASPIGWINHKGDGEFAVGIRAGLIESNRAFLFSGCGVVGDSKPIDEYKETKAKFIPTVSAVIGKYE